MNRNDSFASIVTLFFVALHSMAFSQQTPLSDKIISYTVDAGKQDCRLYWKDDSGHILGSIQRLKDYLSTKNKILVFAMNGGMFTPGYSPVGLFIQEKKLITPLNTASGGGNFFLKPNGVFYITKDRMAGICSTEKFTNRGQVAFATQSGPMLVIDGLIHPAFKEGSANTNLRNGVGLLPGNKLIFAMSKEPVNFFDFALYFKNLGCRDALYLDGFISQTYLPEKNWVQTGGDFGVLIGVSVPVP